MDRDYLAQPPAGVIEPQTRQGQLIASALLDVYHRVSVKTCAAYLPTDDGCALAMSVTVDSPLSFGIPAGFSIDEMVSPSVRAYRTGKLVVFDEARALEEARRSRRPLPILVPFPMTLVAAPIRTPGSRFGTIAVRGMRSRPQECAYLQSAADRLAVDLEDLAGGAEGVTAPAVPVFIPADPEPTPGEAAAAMRSSYLYQMQRLGTELTGAVQVADILAITQDRVVRAFGGTAAALSVVESGHLHVVGATGLPRAAVHDIEGTPLSRRTPETDTITAAAIRMFTSGAELEQAYPAVSVEHDQRARGYFPLLYGGHVTGCCSIVFAEAQRPLSSPETALLTLMVEQVAQALGRARAHEAEQALTRRIQRTLLPGSAPHIPQALTTARYFPATEGAAVGGDWYDVLNLPEGRIGLVIGDVEGHNLDAAVLMGQLRSAVRAYAAEGHDPMLVLERSNRLLRGLDTGLFATCCCMWIDLVTGAAAIASAGHPGPLILRNQKVLSPELIIGPPLGIDAQAAYRDTNIELAPGSVCALFTDGLLEVRRLGYTTAVRRLADLLAAKGGEDLERLADAMSSNGRTPRSDDAALVLMRYEGAAPRDQARITRMAIQRHDLHGVAQARRFLQGVLRDWDMPAAQDNLEVLVSEVVTNALIHAHSEVDLRLRAYPDKIRVEVRDNDPYPPVPTELLDDEERNVEAESGRGLLIVDALASAWGSSPAGRGKITWFEIGVHDKKRTHKAVRGGSITGTSDANP